MRPAFQCLDEHIDTAQARAYANDDPPAVERWHEHIDRCVSCRSLVKLLRNPPLPTPPRLFERDYVNCEGVIQLANWPIDHWVHLSPENIDDPEIARLAERVEVLFEQHCNHDGYVSECSLRERLERDDIVLVAIDPHGDSEPVLQGAIFGRLSRYLDPTFDELGCNDVERARSLNFYAVVIDEEHDERSITLKLCLAASHHFTSSFPGLVVQTMTPVAGLRPYAARLSGLSTSDATPSSTTSPPSTTLDDLLRGRRLASGSFESVVGLSPREWLQRGCVDPPSMLDQWRKAEKDGKAAMSGLISMLAEHYACDVWMPPRDGATSESCPGASSQPLPPLLRTGAKFSHTRAFSRLDDPESLYTTATFEHPTVNLAETAPGHGRRASYGTRL